MLQPPELLLAVADVPLDTHLDGLVEGEADRLDFDQAEGPVQALVEVVQDDQPQEAVVADHLGQGPAGLPPLLGVQVGEAERRWRRRRTRLGQGAAQLPEEGRQFVEQDFVMDALGGRLLLDGPLRPAVDQGGGVPPDDGPDLGVPAGPNRWPGSLCSASRFIPYGVVEIRGPDGENRPPNCRGASPAKSIEGARASCWSMRNGPAAPAARPPRPPSHPLCCQKVHHRFPSPHRTMSHTLRRLAVVVLAVVLVLTQPRSPAAEVRTWSDASGQFSVKAEFVRAAGGKVTLKTDDGNTVEIELAKLSPADQKYVAEQQAKPDNPFKKKSESPFQPKGKGDDRQSPR